METWERARDLYEAAMDDSEAAIKRDRRNAYAYCTRAVTKVAFDLHDDAIKDFDRAIKLKQDFAHAYHQRRARETGTRAARKKRTLTLRKQRK